MAGRTLPGSAAPLAAPSSSGDGSRAAGARRRGRARASAGLARRDGELRAAGSLVQANAMVGQRILQQVGQTGIPVVNVANACATGSTAFREAWLAVAAGEHEVALAVGVE